MGTTTTSTTEWILLWLPLLHWPLLCNDHTVVLFGHMCGLLVCCHFYLTWIIACTQCGTVCSRSVLLLFGTVLEHHLGLVPRPKHSIVLKRTVILAFPIKKKNLEHFLLKLCIVPSVISTGLLWIHWQLSVTIFSVNKTYLYTPWLWPYSADCIHFQEDKNGTKGAPILSAAWGEQWLWQPLPLKKNSLLTRKERYIEFKALLTYTFTKGFFNIKNISPIY